ncbi:MAG: type II toxin-antitoxin system RelE/ParE family toxin [Pseudanabaena sp. CAN_BIN31]|nr:type II toxin-antitoxin system RelE/ParE family toxin [Pseudanabaena sp. CAN_BIN31]
MILTFLNQGTEDVFNGKNTKQARKVCPASITRIAVRKLDQINVATILNDLRAPPHNHLESLLGDRLGQHSIRINNQYRICSFWTNTGASQVEIVDYH